MALQFPDTGSCSNPLLENADLGFLILLEKNIFIESSSTLNKIRIGDIDTMVQTDSANLEIFGEGYTKHLPVFSELCFSYCRTYPSAKVVDEPLRLLCVTVFDKKNLYLIADSDFTCIYHHQRYIFAGFKNGDIVTYQTNGCEGKESPSQLVDLLNEILSKQGKSIKVRNPFSLWNHDNPDKSRINDITFFDQSLLSIDDNRKVISWKLENLAKGKHSLVKLWEVTLPQGQSDFAGQFRFYQTLIRPTDLIVSCNDVFYEVADVAENHAISDYGGQDVTNSKISTILVSEADVFLVGFDNGEVRMYIKGKTTCAARLLSFTESRILSIIPAFYANQSKDQKALNISEGLNFLAILTEDLKIHTFELDDQFVFLPKSKIDILEELRKSLPNAEIQSPSSAYSIWAFR